MAFDSHLNFKVGSIYLVDVMPESVPVALGILTASIDVSSHLNIYYYYDQITSSEVNAIVKQLPSLFNFTVIKPPSLFKVAIESLRYFLHPTSFIATLFPVSAIKHISFIMDWKTYQMSHAMLDAAASSSIAASAQMTLKHRLIGLLSVATGLKLSREIQAAKPDILIMGHMVYRSRACLANLRKLKSLTILQHVGHYLYRLTSDKDLYYGENHIRRCLSSYFSGDSKLMLSASTYWNHRTDTGGSNYDLTAIVSAYSKKLQEVSFEPLAPNYIFLHVFRDSPFHSIDRHRLFIDYVDWIRHTLNIIRSTPTKWALKLHPSAKFWGENQYHIINKIIAGVELGDNILIDNRSIPSVAILNKLNKVITYNGTVALEAIALDLRPIIIQHGPWSDYLHEYCYLPNNLYEYKNLLLSESERGFRISRSFNSNHSNIAKLILFAREKYYSLENVQNPELRGVRTISSSVDSIRNNFNVIKSIPTQNLAKNFI